MIGAEVNRIVYKGDGITTSFPYTFTVLKKADIVVTLVDKESKKKTLTSDYFIDMDKKEITYPGYAPGEEPAEAERPPVLPAGWYLVIQRKTKIDQQTSLGDKWPFDVTEDALDKITRILQDLDTDSKRHLKVSVEASGIDPMLPSPKANMGFYWDETGTKLVEGLNPKAASESAASSAAAARSAAAASASAKSSAYHMEFAQRWAASSVSPDDNADSESTTGMTQSSKTWALYAKAKAAESAERADATIGADEEAETYAQDAKTYMAAAKKAAADATTQAAAASVSEKAAQTSETSAAASASAAKASANAARESEKNADSRAQDAESAANDAKGYVASALADKTAAESAANTAKTYAETATKKATAAGDSQTAAAHSASSAKASADHAGESATIAADNAATATTCAAQASNARDAAIGAKDGAEAAQANAKASATAATNSAASAQESAEKAKGYAAITNPVTSVKEDTTKGGIVVTNALGGVTVVPLIPTITLASAEDIRALFKEA